MGVAPVVELEWAHAVVAVLGAVAGAASGIFAGGWRLGRIESRLKLSFQQAITDSEKRLEAKVDEERHAFDETLRALRQKINDVEMGAEKRFLQKEDFAEFRQEYRDDMKRIFDKLDSLPRGRS